MKRPSHPIQDQPIAVVGVSALYPGQPGSEGFWNDILAGRDLIQDVPESHWLIEDYYDPDPSVPDKTYAKRGSFLPPVDFDTLKWGMPPSLVPMTDTTQLLALIVAQQVLQDAAGDAFEEMDRSRISVILGVTSAQELLGLMVSRLQRPVWVKALRETGLSEESVEEACERIASHYTPWNESTFPGLLGNVVAGRIANRLNLGGTNCVTDAACASSFSAVSMAVGELLLGDSDMVITGGADTLNDIFMYMCFSKTPALSKSGECAPFSDQADGTLLGEGIGMVALKRLADAERDGNKIYAVIRGVGSSSDGRSKSVYAPVPEGQARALQRAYDQAAYGPRTVELVEAHGTGTTAGDAAEMAGLKLAFSDESGAKQWCALGTVKSQIGHTKAAAGAAGLFKVVMALHHRVLPPTLKIGTPNPSLGVSESPFYLNTQSRPWVRGADHPRRASVSSFGFGGSNFHLALEEYVGDARPERMRATPAELILLGAEDPAALVREARRIADTLEEEGLRRFAHESVHDPSSGPARACLIARDTDDLRSQLRWLAGQIEKNPAVSISTPQGGHYAYGQEPGDVALLFPGQGSQYVHMARDVAIHLDAALAPLDAAADDRPDGQRRLSDVFLPPPVFTDAAARAQEDTLRETEWAQPSLGLTSLCYLELVKALGLEVTGALGHSFGELTALMASGSMEPKAFLDLARARGELMAEAAKTSGAMTAAQAGPDELVPHVEAAEDVSFANYNSPTQTVLSGTVEAVEALERRLADAGIETRRLPVATAFHSPVVAAAVPGFRQRLEEVDFLAPKWPVYSGSVAQPHASDAESIRERLASGIADPVRFVECVEDLYGRGARVFIEVGAGSVLTRLVSETLGERAHHAIPMDRRSKPGWEALCESIGRLYVAGVKANYHMLWSGYGTPEKPADTSARPTIPLSGSNYGKPYPPPGGRADLPPPNAHSKETPVSPPTPAKVPETPAPMTVHHAPSLTGETMSTQPPIYNDPWLLAFQEAQRATADAHASYQSAMRDSHVAYLHAMESSLHTLAHLAGGDPLPVPEAPRRPMPQPEPPSPAAQPLPPAPPVTVAPTPLVIPTATPASSGPAVQRISDVVAAPKPLPAAAPTPPAAPPSGGLGDTLLAIVADKTGYPTDLLHLEMKLESDLGVDSIKRVEILSALREAIPSLPEVNPGDLAKLSTLGQIVEHLGGAEASPQANQAPEITGTHGLGDTLLAIVADKTGYPTDLLHLEMKLESDLGVDSIKRVEILSALREAIPSLPEVNPGDLAKLSTLGQIVEHLSGHAPSGPRKASPRESSHPSKEPPPMR